MNCLLCGSQKNHIINRIVSFDVVVVYLQCERCGLIFQSREESQAWQTDFYAETYRSVYQGSAAPSEKDIWVQKQRAINLLHLLERSQIRRFTRILDVGASTGTLLESFQRFYQCVVMGVEPGDAYRAYAEAKGLTMFPSLDDALAAGAGKFDLISLIHVLEHLPDPVGTLRQIREELLSEDGLLLLEVPNFYAHDSYELAHLTCFTPHSLAEVVKHAGYRVTYRHQHGVPRSTLLNLYVTLTAEPIPKPDALPPIQPDRHVRLKRRLGFLYRRLAQKFFPHQAWLPLPEEKLV